MGEVVLLQVENGEVHLQRVLVHLDLLVDVPPAVHNLRACRGWREGEGVCSGLNDKILTSSVWGRIVQAYSACYLAIVYIFRNSCGDENRTLAIDLLNSIDSS